MSTPTSSTLCTTAPRWYTKTGIARSLEPNDQGCRRVDETYDAKRVEGIRIHHSIYRGGRTSMTDKMPTHNPVAGVRNTGLSRRGFLRGVGATGAAAAGAGLLAACGDDEGTDGGSGSGNDDPILNFANWPLYIDTKRVDGEKTYPTLEAFEEQTGITVNYDEPINDNEEYFGQIRPLLAAG